MEVTVSAPAALASVPEKMVGRSKATSSVFQLAEPPRVIDADSAAAPEFL